VAKAVILFQNHPSAEADGNKDQNATISFLWIFLANAFVIHNSGYFKSPNKNVKTGFLRKRRA
jgi:hypothetical protein